MTRFLVDKLVQTDACDFFMEGGSNEFVRGSSGWRFLALVNAGVEVHVCVVNAHLSPRGYPFMDLILHI